MREESPKASESLWAAGDARSVVRRVWLAQPAIGAVMSAIALGIGTPSDALGVLAGTALAMVNFRFLRNSLWSILGAGHEKAPPGTALMFALRWVVVATVAFALYRLGWMSLGGILAGLFAPAIAVALEAVYQLASTLAHGLESDNN
jgi:hypothetical protein